jgi:hypothetical protein
MTAQLPVIGHLLGSGCRRTAADLTAPASAGQGGTTRCPSGAVAGPIACDRAPNETEIAIVMSRGWMRPPISPRGRFAAFVVAVCMIVAGIAFLVSAFDELRCPYQASVCGTTVGIAGIIIALALAAVGTGVAGLVSLRGRPLLDDGYEGWVIVEAALALVAAAVLALLVPSRTCPPGFRLYRTFRMCIDPSAPERRAAAQTHISLEWLVFACGAVVALVVLRQRWLPRWIPALLTVAIWAGAMGWLLFETVLPRTY